MLASCDTKENRAKNMSTVYRMKHHHQNRTMGLIGLVVLGVMLAACQPAATPQPQAQTQGQGFGNGQRPNFQEQPAPELPTDQPGVRGVVVSGNGATLTVQEGGGFGGGNFGGNGTPRAPQNGTPRPRPTQGPTTDIQVDASSATV